MTKALMIQGAGSSVGKSLVVAGLARLFARRGLAVRPFKPQNMSNNAAVTADGGEIGRAQALQARAAGVAPLVDMNPVLLKPETETGAQVIIQGQRVGTMRAAEWGSRKAEFLPRVMESFTRLAKDADLILVEGAGSPAETNLRAGDIANMGFAQAANLPVILVGDIDRGGVIAQCVGTHAVLPPDDRNRIKGVIINKFRGDPALFAAGMDEVVARTGWAALGVLPFFEDAWRLPAEDVLDLINRSGGATKIVVPRLGRIANFDDLDPLAAEPSVTVEIVEPGRPLPVCDLILLPGSKTTIKDLAALRTEGWDIDISAHIRRGGHVLGLCGGYQMLGNWIDDPDGIEGTPGRHPGLGHLNVTTKMHPEKRLAQVTGTYLPTGDPIRGYEIHIGATDGPDCARGWLSIQGQMAGAASPSDRVRGCYLHGVFAADAARAAMLAQLGAIASGENWDAGIDTTLDRLADHLATHLDTGAILGLAAKI